MLSSSMFPTTYATTASLSEPARVGDRHTRPARSPSVGGIPSRAVGLLGIMFATLGVPQAIWAQTVDTLLLKLQTYPQIKTPLHFYGTFGLLPFISLFLSHLLTPITKTLPPYRQHCSTPLIIKILLVHLTSNAEEAEVEWYYEDLQDLLERTSKKDVLFITGDWNAKVGSQEIPQVTGKFSLGVQNEAGQRLIECCRENALVIANTMDITRWLTLKSDWLYSL